MATPRNLQAGVAKSVRRLPSQLISGFVVARGMLASDRMPRWTAAFLISTILTSVTGFPLPPFGLDLPRLIGIISLFLLLAAVLGYYAFHLKGPWRWVYTVTAVISLYFNVFVFIVQAFQKVFFLNAIAPTQTEWPFVIAQVIALIGFVALGFFTAREFRPAAVTASI